MKKTLIIIFACLVSTSLTAEVLLVGGGGGPKNITHFSSRGISGLKMGGPKIDRAFPVNEGDGGGGPSVRLNTIKVNIIGGDGDTGGNPAFSIFWNKKHINN